MIGFSSYEMSYPDFGEIGPRVFIWWSQLWCGRGYLMRHLQLSGRTFLSMMIDGKRKIGQSFRFHAVRPNCGQGNVTAYWISCQCPCRKSSMWMSMLKFWAALLLSCHEAKLWTGRRYCLLLSNLWIFELITDNWPFHWPGRKEPVFYFTRSLSYFSGSRMFLSL